jgi:hypothetical protein
VSTVALINDDCSKLPSVGSLPLLTLRRRVGPLVGGVPARDDGGFMDGRRLPRCRRTDAPRASGVRAAVLQEVS